MLTKTEETRFNVTSSNKLKVDGKDIKQVDKLIYLGSVVSIEDSTKKRHQKTDYQKQERPSTSYDLTENQTPTAGKQN